jgi:hypothetical protein
MPNIAGVPASWYETPGIASPKPVCAAFFLGTGGAFFSQAWSSLADKVKATGVNVGVYDYTDYPTAQDWLQQCAKAGLPVAVAGYSAGVVAATIIQTEMPVDLLISVAASTYEGANNRPVAPTTRRSHLFWGPDDWSNACVHGCGYDETTYVPMLGGIWLLSHIFVPTSQVVTNGVLAEFAKLQGASSD